MECENFKKDIDAYIDGAMCEEEKKHFEAHLENCPACCKEAEAYMKLRGELRALRLEDTDDFVFDFARVKSPAVVPFHKRGWVRALSSAAACFVLLIGVYTATQNGYTPSGESDSEIVQTEGESAASEGEITVASESGSVTDDAANGKAAVPYAPNTYAASESDTIYSADAQVKSRMMPMLASDENAEEAASNGANAPQRTKRVVTLQVQDVYKAAFETALSELRFADENGEVVISVATLENILGMDGVVLVSDDTLPTDTDTYVDRIVVKY